MGNLLNFKDILVKETEGRSYGTKAVLLKVSSHDATATPPVPSQIVFCPTILPIYRTGHSFLIGYANVEQHDRGLIFRLFLDYSTPERLELENGEKRYLEFFQQLEPSAESGQSVGWLELTSKVPEDDRMLSVGDPEGGLL